MKYLFLINASKIIDWARTLVTSLNQREADLDAQLKSIRDRLDAGGL